MTKSITLSEPKLVSVQQQLHGIVIMVQQARSMSDIADIEDQRSQVDAYLKTRRAAIEMGDDLEVIRVKLREITLECEIRKAELAKDLSPKDMTKVSKDLNIPIAHLVKAAAVGNLSKPIVRSALEVQTKKGLEPSVNDVHALTRLKSDNERRSAIAKLGDVKSVSDAVNSVQGKVAPNWKPSAPTSQPKPATIVDPTAIKYANLSRILRDQSNKMVLLTERFLRDGTSELSDRISGLELMIVDTVEDMNKINLSPWKK
jgi:hypothetical protein